MVSSDSFVSVVAPLYNDADILVSFVESVVEVLEASYSNWELVLVDDGSTDETVDCVTKLLAKHECMRLIRLSRSFGHEIAISAGLDSVIGDFVVVMRPDSDPPELIPEIVETARQGAGIVFGIRRERDPEPLLFRLGLNLFYAYLKRFLKLNIPKNSTDFRVLSRQSVNAITRIKDRTRHLRTYGTQVGFASQSFEYDPILRRDRPRRMSFFAAVGLGISMIVANSTQPLRIVTWVALSVGLVNALYVGYVIAVRLLVQEVVGGWATLSLQIATMFILLFTILAVLSEYIGRLLSESGDRPVYYVLEERSSSVLIADADRKNVVTESMDEE